MSDAVENTAVDEEVLLVDPNQDPFLSQLVAQGRTLMPDLELPKFEVRNKDYGVEVLCLVCKKKAELENADEATAFAAISKHMMDHFGITEGMLGQMATMMGLGGSGALPGQSAVPYEGSSDGGATELQRGPEA